MSADHRAGYLFKNGLACAGENCSGPPAGLSYLSGKQSNGSGMTEPLLPGEVSDEDLLSQARAGSDPAQSRELVNQLFSRYYLRIARWCLHITGERNSAADLAQDVLIKAYKALDFFRGDAKFSTWLYTITRNHCINDAKRRAVRYEDKTESIEEDLPAPEEFESKVEREQMIRQLHQLLRENLDETEQQVMALHYGEELTLDVITRLLGLTNPSGAKAHIVSARRKLKAALARQQARAATKGRAC